MSQPLPEIMNRSELADMMSSISEAAQFSSDIKENVQVCCGSR